MLSVNQHFRGGLLVHSPTYGLMPWWPSVLSMCDDVTRQLAYEEMRKAGDTHAIIHVQSGPVGRDPHGKNFYANPDKFHTYDWTFGFTTMDPMLSFLVDEVISHGFKFVITMDEIEANSLKTVPLVMHALSPEQLAFGIVIPGYDGVFSKSSSWPPASIEQWGMTARSIRPDAYLGIEHGPGYIPVGGGPADWQANGRMRDYDVVFGEFPTVSPSPVYREQEPDDSENNTACNEVWQTLQRMQRGYKRPPEQPAHVDPTTTFYLVDSARGPRSYCAWETWEPYQWVRVNMNDPNAIAAEQRLIEAERQYFKSVGCQFIG